MDRPSTRLVRFLGKDKHGFKYFLGLDLYIYQQYPIKDYFVNGTNKKGNFNGWFTSLPVWEMELHTIITH